MDANHCVKYIRVQNAPCIEEKYQSDLLQIEGFQFYGISRSSCP